MLNGAWHSKTAHPVSSACFTRPGFPSSHSNCRIQVPAGCRNMAWAHLAVLNRLLSELWECSSASVKSEAGGCLGLAALLGAGADEGIVHLHLVCWQQRWGSSCGALALEFLVSLCCSPTDCFPVGKHLQEEVIHHLWKATDAEMWSIPSFPETGSAGPAGAVRDLTLDRTILFFFLALNNVNHLSFFLPLERVFSVT